MYLTTYVLECISILSAGPSCLSPADKSEGSEKRFYRSLLHAADARFDGHLARLKKENPKMKTLTDKIAGLSEGRRRLIFEVLVRTREPPNAQSVAVQGKKPTVRTIRTVSFLIVVLVTAFAVAAQEAVESLKDIARRNGGVASSKIDGESPSMSIRDLAQQSDLIVRGRLERITTRLSDDESTVFRDFTVTSLVVIKQRADLSQARRPAQLPALTLRQLGGRILVDGLTLTTTTNFEDRETPMEAGQEYILFLSSAPASRSTTMSTGSGVFQLMSAHWGAFPIRNGKVSNFSKWVAQRTDRATDDPAAFVAQIRALAASK
jgi:hypothetical protein